MRYACHECNTHAHCSLVPSKYYRLRRQTRVFSPTTNNGCEEELPMRDANSSRPAVVLVTGASGFLGQYIVKLLQETEDDVDEIRTFDIDPFIKRLDYEEKKRCRSIVGDITNLKSVLNACDGVECVIHAAALVDFSPNPDPDAMYRVNVKGTENVIEACLEKGVRRLIYTSTVDVVVDKKRLAYARENQVSVPEKPLFGLYAKSKYEGERKVLEANGTKIKTADGTLSTLALRPVVMYGEGDPYYITNCLRSAATRGGVLVRLGDGREFMQQSYVGNVAWAHLRARKALTENPGSVGGQAYFINDDTLPCNMFEFLEPFLLSRGYRLSEKAIPFWIIWLMLNVVRIILTLLSPVYKPFLNVTPMAQIYYACNTYVVNRIKATRLLRYAPLYTADEAMKKALHYYSSVKL